MADINPTRRRMLDYLSSFGLVGSGIHAGEWDADGFYAEDPITGGLSGKIAWPVGFDFEWFQTAFKIADMEDMRMAQ